MLLRRVAISQRESQLRPFVVFRKDEGQYVVENIGSSAALDVRIDPITLEGAPIQLDISFPRAIPMLKAGTVSNIEVEVHINGERSDPSFAAHLDPRYAIHDIDVHIRFKNVEGREYTLVEIIAPESVSIMGFRGETAL